MKACYIGIVFCLLCVLLVSGCSNRHHKHARSKAKSAHSRLEKNKDGEKKSKYPIILGNHNTTNPIAASVLGH